MVQKMVARFRHPAHGLPLAVGVSSRNLGALYFTISELINK